MHAVRVPFVAFIRTPLGSRRATSRPLSIALFFGMYAAMTPHVRTGGPPHDPGAPRGAPGILCFDATLRAPTALVVSHCYVCERTRTQREPVVCHSACNGLGGGRSAYCDTRCGRGYDRSCHFIQFLGSASSAQLVKTHE